MKKSVIVTALLLLAGSICYAQKAKVVDTGITPEFLDLITPVHSQCVDLTILVKRGIMWEYIDPVNPAYINLLIRTISLDLQFQREIEALQIYEDNHTLSNEENLMITELNSEIIELGALMNEHRKLMKADKK